MKNFLVTKSESRKSTRTSQVQKRNGSKKTKKEQENANGGKREEKKGMMNNACGDERAPGGDNRTTASGQVSIENGRRKPKTAKKITNTDYDYGGIESQTYDIFESEHINKAIEVKKGKPYCPNCKFKGTVTHNGESIQNKRT